MCFNFYLLLLLGIIVFDRITTASASPSIVSQYYKTNQFATDCGIRPPRREPRSQPSTEDPNSSRTAKIIAGTYTKEGQFPWQASLELLHPSLGFLGHWCGAVLIHQYWILSAAHCVHNDLFNLPVPPLWTVVLGEYNRAIESGYEQRIPIDKIVLHKSYQNFLHDLVLMKLSMPADLSKKSNIRRICLPFLFNEPNNDDEEEELQEDPEDPLAWGLAEVPDKMENFLRSVQTMRRYRNVTIPSMKELMDLKILNRLKRQQNAPQGKSGRNFKSSRRRNDKIMKIFQYSNEYDGVSQEKHYHHRFVDNNRDLPYIDCVATGWGKANLTGDLTDLLLKTTVPLHNNRRCREAYGSFVKIHRGHLCAGKLNGKGGTCVGDSGGPLQCRLTKNGPWILAGITSFGSGCAIEGYPDVYTRTSHYMKWIQDTIAFE
ncbi:trypsin-1 [Lucilia sericata]|uniref:trypsin-1 n=1 Tax=Lucilia sericata TaxID=13632 RepID=UPI0018A7FB4F|nr:trypsin-1 [Lucilia sericata]